MNFRQQQLARISRRHAQAFNQRPQGRTRIGSCCSGHVGGPTEWFCRVGGPEGFLFFNTSSSYGHRPHSSASRLRMMCSCETSTPHGPAACLRACVMDVSRRCECSDVARMAYGACADDMRSSRDALGKRRFPGGGKGLKNTPGEVEC